MQENDQITLIVMEAIQDQDVGKDIARVSWETMELFNLSRGDVIEIEGLYKTYATVYPTSAAGPNVVHIDGNIRRRAGLAIREQAVIRKEHPKEAARIVFQIVRENEDFDLQEIEKILAQQLQDEILFVGKAYRIPANYSRSKSFEDILTSLGLGQGTNISSFFAYLIVIITQVDPEGVVFLTQNTHVSVSATSAVFRKRTEAVTPESKIKEEGAEKKKHIPDVHYEDIGGLDRELALVRELIELPLRNPELFERLGVEPPKGVLLYGPPGTGKTLIAQAVANEVNAHFIPLSGPEIINKIYGESENRLREIFEEAEIHAPTVIFFDEIDSIAPKRAETTSEVDRRIVAQLLSLMDGLKSRGKVIVIAATNLLQNIDPALRRGGRFDREIETGIPDINGRLTIFQIHSRNVPLDISSISYSEDQLTRDERRQLSGLMENIADLDKKISSDVTDQSRDDQIRRLNDIKAQKEEYESLIRRRIFLQPFANQTHGFVGADISLTVKEAAMHALRKALEIVPPKDLKEGRIDPRLFADIRVKQNDFQAALTHVEPSAMREVLIEVTDVTWDDIGGLEDVKTELREAIEWPILYSNLFTRLETKTPKGILLFGPPGTGKTLIAKAIAHESECNFITVKGPELISKWVGESEKGIREVFRKARLAAPSIIFFDEIDALVPKRGSYSGSAHVIESVVSQILTEMDGMEELKNVTIIAATNRPDIIDTALLRPGRIERHIYVPPPDREGRRKILGVYLHETEKLLTSDITIDDLVDRTEGFVGADIEALVREAKFSAMREFISLMNKRSNREMDEAVSYVRITGKHFDQAFKKVQGTLDEKSREEYEQQAWHILFNPKQREILEKAVSVISDAKRNRIEDSLIENLYKEVYGQTDKNFHMISQLSEELEKKCAKLNQGEYRYYG